MKISFAFVVIVAFALSTTYSQPVFACQYTQQIQEACQSGAAVGAVNDTVTGDDAVGAEDATQAGLDAAANAQGQTVNQCRQVVQQAVQNDPSCRQLAEQQRANAEQAGQNVQGAQAAAEQVQQDTGMNIGMGEILGIAGLGLAAWMLLGNDDDDEEEAEEEEDGREYAWTPANTINEEGSARQAELEEVQQDIEAALREDEVDVDAVMALIQQNPDLPPDYVASVHQRLDSSSPGFDYYSEGGDSSRDEGVAVIEKTTQSAGDELVYGESARQPASEENLQFYLENDMFSAATEEVCGWVEEGRVAEAAAELERLKRSDSIQDMRLAEELKACLAQEKQVAGTHH